MLRRSSLAALLAALVLTGCPSTNEKGTPDKGTPEKGKPDVVTRKETRGGDEVTVEDTPKTSQKFEPFRAEWGRLKRLELAPGQDVGGDNIHDGDGASVHVFVTRARDGFHRHDKSDEILIALEGTALVHLPGGEGIILEAGHGVLIPAGTVHDVECHPETGKDMPFRALRVFTPNYTAGDKLDVCSICRDFATGPSSLCPGCVRVVCDSHRSATVPDAPRLCSVEGKRCPGPSAKVFVPDKRPTDKKPTLFSLPMADDPKKPAPGVATEVARGPNASVHRIRAVEPIPGHFHKNHAETVFLYDGEGVCKAGDSGGGVTPYPVKPGAVLHLPRERPHSYEPYGANRAGQKLGPSRAISIYSPAFDPADRVPVNTVDFGVKPLAPTAAPGGTPENGGPGQLPPGQLPPGQLPPAKPPAGPRKMPAGR